jgi:hypothetical protein
MKDNYLLVPKKLTKEQWWKLAIELQGAVNIQSYNVVDEFVRLMMDAYDGLTEAEMEEFCTTYGALGNMENATRMVNEFVSNAMKNSKSIAVE